MIKKIAGWWNEVGDFIIVLSTVIQFAMFIPISNRLLSVPYGWICNLGMIGGIHTLIAFVLELTLCMIYSIVWLSIDFVLTYSVVDFVIFCIKRLFKF